MISDELPWLEGNTTVLESEKDPTLIHHQEETFETQAGVPHVFNSLLIVYLLIAHYSKPNSPLEPFYNYSSAVSSELCSNERGNFPKSIP